MEYVVILWAIVDIYKPWNTMGIHGNIVEANDDLHW